MYNLKFKSMVLSSHRHQWNMLLFGILLIYGPSNLFALKTGKVHLIDSLENSLKIEQLLDSTQIKIHLELGKLLRYEQPARALEHGQEALKKAKLAKIQLYQVDAYNQLALLARNRQEFTQATYYFKSGLTIAKRYAFATKVASIYNNLGNLYHRWNKLDSALIFLQNSLEIKLSLGDPIAIAKSYNNLGNFFASRGDFKRSKNYYQSGLLIEKEANNDYGIARFHTNLGNTYFQLMRYDSALHFYNRALTYHQTQGNKREIAICLHNLGSINEIEGRYEIALAHYNNSLALSKELQMPLQQINTLNNLGNIYKAKKNRFKQIEFYKAGLELANQYQLVDRQRLLNYQLFESYEALDSFGVALLYHKEYKVLHDSIYNQEQDRIVMEINAKYESEKREKEYLLQKNENLKKSQRLRLLSICTIGLLILMSFALYYGIQKRRSNLQLQLQKKEISKKEKEKALLLRELHHRVKNNLQLIASFLNMQAFQLKGTNAGIAIKESKNRVEAMSIIHRDLYQTENISQLKLLHFLNRLVDNLAASYRIEHLKKNQSIQDVSVSIDIGIPLGLMLNEILTNAFKYVFCNIPNPSLYLELKKTHKSELYIKIKDNGAKILENSPSLNSFGKNLIESLVLQLGAKMKLDSEQGYEYQIWVPI